MLVKHLDERAVLHVGSDRTRHCGHDADHAYTSTAKYNESRFASAKFDQTLDAARSEPNFEKRKKRYWDAQELLNQSGATIVYAFADYIDAHGPAVGGLVSDGARETNGGRSIERV